MEQEIGTFISKKSQNKKFVSYNASGKKVAKISKKLSDILFINISKLNLSITICSTSDFQIEFDLISSDETCDNAGTFIGYTCKIPTIMVYNKSLS